MASIFNLTEQHERLDYKLIAALERLSQAFRVLLWDKAKVYNLSPIQIQCLIYLHYHRTVWGRVGHLAEAFDMTAATISDAISTLVQKGLLSKARSPEDGRVFILELTPQGTAITEEVADWANPLLPIVAGLSEDEKGTTLTVLLRLIEALQHNQTLTIARLCTTCRFFERDAHSEAATPHHCRLLNTPLAPTTLRLDCPEHEPAIH